MILRLHIYPDDKYDKVCHYACIKLATQQHIYISWDINKKAFYISQRVTSQNYFEIYNDTYEKLGILDKLEEENLDLGFTKNILFRYYSEDEINNLFGLLRLLGYPIQINRRHFIWENDNE